MSRRRIINLANKFIPFFFFFLSFLVYPFVCAKNQRRHLRAAGVKAIILFTIFLLNCKSKLTDNSQSSSVVCVRVPVCSGEEGETPKPSSTTTTNSPTRHDTARAYISLRFLFCAFPSKIYYSVISHLFIYRVRLRVCARDSIQQTQIDLITTKQSSNGTQKRKHKNLVDCGSWRVRCDAETK